MKAFLERPLEGDWPYLWLDATYLKVREGGRIVSVAAIIAVAANTEGRREIVGLGIGPSGSRDLLGGLPGKRLTRRGLRGVKLVISDVQRTKGWKRPPSAVGRRGGDMATRCRGALRCAWNALAYRAKDARRRCCRRRHPRGPSSSPTARRAAPGRSGGTSPINCGPGW